MTKCKLRIAQIGAISVRLWPSSCVRMMCVRVFAGSLEFWELKSCYLHVGRSSWLLRTHLIP